MGAGCYYTHENVDAKAFWIELEIYEDFDLNEELFSNTLRDLSVLLIDMNYHPHDELNFSNGLYNLELKSKYNGDGLLFLLEPLYEDWRIFNLAVANHSYHYERLAKALIKYGYSLGIATSGYTSAQLKFS
jgi:hypothetical protein